MTPAVQLIRAASLAEAPHAYAATAPAGSRLIFLAGACPLNDDGSTAAPGDYTAQAARCVRNLEEALDAAGATLNDVISTRVLVASSLRADLATVWDVVHAAFGSHDVPSTLLGVTVLGYEDQLVEIEAIAAVLDECESPWSSITDSGTPCLHRTHQRASLQQDARRHRPARAALTAIERTPTGICWVDIGPLRRLSP